MNLCVDILLMLLTFISHVMNFVKDDPRDLTHDFGSTVQHGSQNLCRHDQARGTGVDGNISCHQTNIAKLLQKLSVLLVRQGLDRTGVDDTLLSSKGGGDSKLGDDGFTG